MRAAVLLRWQAGANSAGRAGRLVREVDVVGSKNYEFQTVSLTFFRDSVGFDQHEG